MTNTKYAVKRERPVGELMTPLPHVVGADQSVADALSRMRALGIRHMPVVHEDRVIGVLSEREASLIHDIPQCDPSIMAVGDLVSSEPCSVAPDAALSFAVESMAAAKSDCCVVLDDERMVGILTSSDIMHLLSTLLCSRSGPKDHGLRPSEVRARILAEHRVIRGLAQTIVQLAGQVLEGDEQADAPLRERSREMYQTLLRHIELEDTILAPIIRDVDSFGPVRAGQMQTEHERQRKELHDALAALDDSSAMGLAATTRELVKALLIDMGHEERALLHEDLLRDDLISVDTSTG